MTVLEPVEGISPTGKKNIGTDSPTARLQELAFLDIGLFNVCLRRMEALPPKPRRLAQIKKN